MSTSWEFVPLGPWPAGTVIRHVDLWLYVSDAETVRITGGFCQTPDLSIANVAAGKPLLLHSDNYQDGVPILELPLVSEQALLVPLALNHTIRTGPSWIIVAGQKDVSLNVFTFVASATTAIHAYAQVPIAAPPLEVAVAVPPPAFGVAGPPVS